METYYLIIVLILFTLAISDLIVGVSNDAVNFLNSAIGSKVAPFRVIMFVAALGVLVGATFSSGLMEVARKGIFHPGQFVFAEIMIIFLAVMITDVILLDSFNTLGLPTSTTVSIVFELLGAAVAISIIKINAQGETLQDLYKYINSAKALAIITGILLSVVIAFSVGAIVQYITRIIFSFRYEKNLRLYGAVWGGLAITAIVYFILIKGAKGSSFMTSANVEWIKTNTVYILLGSFISLTAVFQILMLFFKINILKGTVLLGTFALAMAFAGNDLVNFIGVPLAGYESFKAYVASQPGDPWSFTMEVLGEKINTNTYILLTAGLVMVVTLFFSKKAKSVVKTSLDLSRQNEGDERFSSTMFSRALVRRYIRLGDKIQSIIPAGVQRKIQNQFTPTSQVKSQKGPAADASFDLIRASVNLVVASILIAIGTSLKLPLSTTYVTFMVAMGTSLSDRAWGRESAVYRITGVISVIGGWFFTAFSAFTVSFLMAVLIYHGKILAVLVLIGLALFFVIRTQFLFNRRESDREKNESLALKDDDVSGENILKKCINNVGDILETNLKLYSNTIKGLAEENLKLLRKTNKKGNTLNKEIKYLKNKTVKTIQLLEEDSIDTGHYYVQVLDYLREIVHNITFIITPSLEHIDNNHKPISKEQIEDLNEIKDHFSDLSLTILHIIKENRYEEFDIVITKLLEFQKIIKSAKKNQIQRIKKDTTGTKSSILFLNIVQETRVMSLNAVNLVKSQRDFILNQTLE